MLIIFKVILRNDDLICVKFDTHCIFYKTIQTGTKDISIQCILLKQSLAMQNNLQITL